MKARVEKPPRASHLVQDGGDLLVLENEWIRLIEPRVKQEGASQS